jgi:hypothetical protein
LVGSPWGFGLGVKVLVKAARGQSSHDATGLGAQAEVATWLAGSGRHRPFCVTGRGKRGNSPSRNLPDWVTGARELGVRASSLARPSHPLARSRGAGRSVRCGAAWGKRRRRMKK